MDKKTETALLRRRNAPPPEPTPASAAQPLTAPAPEPTSPPGAASQTPSGWWMYHGDPEHTGFVSDSDIDSSNVNTLVTPLFSLQLGGPVLSVPAVVDGFIYVGLANYHGAEGGNGGALRKIDIQTGKTVATFAWDLGNDIADVHKFSGMGMTPAIINGRVYFGAFNGKFYCLDQETLELQWVTDLRNQDLAHNQPMRNVMGASSYAAAVMWSSPVFNADATKLYVGCGEGENPLLYSFVFCLDVATGNVSWIYCTNLFCDNEVNQPNVLPLQAVQDLPPPAGYSIFEGAPIVMGCSVWGSIAYDRDLNRLYCPTGNQQPEPNNDWQWADTTQPPPPFKPELPSPGYSNGILALDADTGEHKGFWQVPPDSNYRPSDGDIDIGSSPVLYTSGEQRVVAIACKNGSVFTLDAATLQLLNQRQLLPHMNDGTRIPTVDPHSASGDLNPHMTNELSDAIPGENYSGAFNTAAYHPGSQDSPPSITPRLFIAIGGPNYHSASPGIDSDSTPFMRAVDATTLADVWPLDKGDPQRYLNTQHMDTAQGMQVGMYSNAGESGLSSPAVVNDVVFCTTSKISIYAFSVHDGTLLWMDDMGMQTDGYNGGYGYCIGPAIWKNYVVAGSLVAGLDGGVLKIYSLPAPQSPPAS
jgi:outer membrane protein assembly factor BamB